MLVRPNKLCVGAQLARFESTVRKAASDAQILLYEPSLEGRKFSWRGHGEFGQSRYGSETEVKRAVRGTA